MQIHDIKRENKNKRKKTVGRGGKRGKTSGRGTKGQKARSGRKLRPEMRDTIKKFPKKRGYKFKSIQDANTIVKLKTLNENFKDGEKVTPKILLEKKIIKRVGGKVPPVKILDNAPTAKKYNIEGCLVSGTVKEKIEKAGGTIK